MNRVVCPQARSILRQLLSREYVLCDSAYAFRLGKSRLIELSRLLKVLNEAFAIFEMLLSNFKKRERKERDEKREEKKEQRREKE